MPRSSRRHALRAVRSRGALVTATLARTMLESVADARNLIRDAGGELVVSYHVDTHGEVYRISERGSIGRLRERTRSAKRRALIASRVMRGGSTRPGASELLADPKIVGGE